MNLIKRVFALPLKASLLILASCFYVVTGHAALLGVSPTTPLFIFNNNLTVLNPTSYTPGTEVFKVSARPDDVLLTGATSLIVVDDSTNAGAKKLTINIKVDSTGALAGNHAGHDLVLIGKVVDGVVVVGDDMLLTAEVTGFGYLESGNTDFFDMSFNITGGTIASLYPSGNIGVKLTSEGSTFVNFTKFFRGEAKGQLGLITFTPNPDIEICTLVSVDGGLTYFDADNFTADGCGGYNQTIPSTLLGEDATYKYVVTNVGNEELSGLVISDTILGTPDINLPGNLLPGNMVMVDALDFNQLAVTDICDGSLSLKANIATATGTGVTSITTVSDDDPAYVECIATPNIDIETEVSIDGGMFFDADTPADAVFASSMSNAEYKLTVTNNGTEDLIDVILNDSELNIVNVNIGNLAVGDSIMFTSMDFASLSVPMICAAANGNIIYNADVSGVGAASGDTVTDIDPAVVVCENPQVTILRQVSIDGGVTFHEADSLATAPIGIVGVTNALYQYIVENVGTEELTSVEITDPALMISGQSIANLAVGEVRTIELGDVGFDNLDVPNVCTDLNFVNGIATIDAIGIGSLAPTSDQNPAYVRCITTPQIDIETEVSVNGGANFYDADTPADAVFASSMSDAEYKLTVTNTSDEELVDVILSDPGFGIINFNIGNMAVNEVRMFDKDDFASLFVPKVCLNAAVGTEIIYSADVDGTGALSNIDVDDTDPAVVICGDPVVKIQKLVSIDGGATFHDADTLATAPVGIVGVTNAVYQYIVTNMGSEALTDVVIDDVSMNIFQPIDDLAVGESTTINFGDPGFDNLDMPNVCAAPGVKSTSATVDAIGADSLSPATDSNPAVVRCIEGPQIMLLNQVSITGAAPFHDADLPGDVDVPVGIVGQTDATYRYIVKNVGGEALTNIVLNDVALGVSNFLLVGVTLQPGDTYTVDVAELGELYVADRCKAVGTVLNTATVSANGINSNIPVNDMNDANVKCTQTSVCGLTINQQCAIVDLPTSNDLLCQAAIKATTLRYTGPYVQSATVVFQGKKGGLATYTNVELISGVTILTSALQNGYTVSSSSAQSDSLGSKTNITINGVLEIIHTSCSAVYYAGRPAPLDGNTPNPANSSKGDPSPNWEVIDFLDKEGNYVTGGTGQPGAFMESCSAISNSAVEVLHKYTVMNTGNTAIELTSINDNVLGEVLSPSPQLIPVGGQHVVQSSSFVSGTLTQSSFALANVAGDMSATCNANDSVEISVEAPMVPLTCSDIKPLTSLSMIWTGQNGVNIETAGGQVFTGVNFNNQITFNVLENDNDTDLYITDTLTGASLGTSRFHKSCSDDEMDGNDDCGMAQGDGKQNEAGLLNLFLLDGMLGENGSFACNVPNSGVVIPANGGPGGGPTDAITAESALDLSKDKIKWRLTNHSDTDLFITEVTVRWPSEHNYIEKIKLEKDFAKDEAVEHKSSPTTVGLADFESDKKKRKLKKNDDKELIVEFKDKYKHADASDYYISVTFDNGQTLTIGTP